MVVSKMMSAERKISRTMTNVEVADVLDKAADLYQAEQVEWCSGKWITVVHSGDEAGSLKMSVCAGGAIALAAGMNTQKFFSHHSGCGTAGGILADPNYDRFNEVLNRTSDYLGQPVVSWNDSPATPRSKADTIDMLKRAAKDIRDDIERES